MYLTMEDGVGSGGDTLDSHLECVKGGYDASGLCDAFSIVM